MTQLYARARSPRPPLAARNAAAVHSGGHVSGRRAGDARALSAADRERWNERHRGALSGEPSSWVTAHRALLAERVPGRALDVACGLGRHALLLAELGFDVDAIDISDVAVARLADEARRRGLAITSLRADLAADASFPRAPYDVIVNTFFLERPLFPRLAAALAPGGLLIVETFGAGEQRIDARHRLGPDELPTAFPTLEVLDHRDGRFEGRDVAGLVARRPPAGGRDAHARGRRIIVACVGNPLRRDDGFGPAVAARIAGLPEAVEVVETGIGGVALLQELMSGCDGLVVVDAVDRGTAPGTVLVIEPEVADAVHVPDVHLANPDRVLSMAKALGCLPERTVIVGCQPVDADGLGQGLSAPVERAVAPAIERIRETVDSWLRDRAPVDSAGR